MSGILLLEDEPIIARNICRALGRGGHTVTHAASAREGRKQLEAARYDLVLADINLGDGDGISLLSAASASIQDVPIVIMSGQDTVGNRLRAEGLAVSAFLSKPFAMSRLAELTGALLAETGKQAGQRRGPSVMMYSHDTIGLGHMRRNTAIAKELVDRVPGASILMLVGCPAGMVFEPHPGIDYIKLPSLTKLGRGRWQAGSLRIDAATTRALRSGILERAIETFAPDVLLVDHEPAGVWEELVQPIRALRAKGRTRVILGLRDILDDPDRVAQAWQGAGTNRTVSDLYDDIFIYGSERFYPSSTAYGLESLLPGRVRYCGTVTAAHQGERIRWDGPPRRVLVSGGGGTRRLRASRYRAGRVRGSGTAPATGTDACRRPFDGCRAVGRAPPLRDPGRGDLPRHDARSARDAGALRSLHHHGRLQLGRRSPGHRLPHRRRATGRSLGRAAHPC